MFSLGGFLTCITVCGLAVGAAAAPSPFSIESYIPERFTDLEWRIDGGVNLRGSAEKTTRDDLVFNERREHDGSQDVDFRSYSEYWYETIPRYLNARVDVVLEANHSGSSRDDMQQATNGLVSRTYEQESDAGGSVYSPWVEFSTTAGQYLAGDVFAELRARVRWRHTEQPGTDESTGSLRVDDYGTYSVTSRYDYERTYRQHRREYRVEAGLFPGIGRIYEGRYAVTALEIMSALRQERLLTCEPSSTELFTLTDMIYRFRNTHAIDTRLYRIETLQAIMSYLQDNGILADAGPYGYLLIQDIWDYYPTERRRFGFKASIGAGGSFTRHRSEHTITGSQRNFDIRYNYTTDQSVDTLRMTSIYTHDYQFEQTDRRDFYLEGKVEFCKPLGLRWQFNGDGIVRYLADSYDSEIDHIIDYDDGYDSGEEEGRRDINDYVLVILQPQLAFLYDARTTVVLDGLVQVLTFDAEVIYSATATRYLSADVNRLLIRLSPQVTYRLSIPTTLRCGASLTYQDEDNFETNSKAWTYSFGAQISHYLY